MRRACRWTPRRSRGYFNPRIPYGMRRRANDTFARDLQFQSTHPVWDATTRQPSISAVSHISIHASRMGCDPDSRRRSNTCYHFNPRIPYGMRRERAGDETKDVVNFNPRIPYGMRLGMTDDYDDSYLFQSTHPVWDATQCSRGGIQRGHISIHASRMGCDNTSQIKKGHDASFQSTHPVWDATPDSHR